MPRVFISYRHDDTAQTAAALRLSLANHLADDAVFLDHQDLGWGERWAARLDEEAAGRDVVMCLIGPNWEGSSGTEPESGRRISEPGDVVRREIALALAAGIDVLPVLVDRADMPTPEDLPDDIQSMPEAQAKPLRSSDYESDFAVLLAKLWQIRLAHLDNTHVVLRVGDRAVTTQQFRSVVEKHYPQELRFVTLAAASRMELTMVDAAAHAPHLYVLLAEDADERDRRVVAVFAEHWDEITIVVTGLTGGFTLTSLLSQPAWSWLRDAIGPGKAAEVVGLPTSASGGASGVLETVRSAAVARPRVVLLAGAVAVGGAAAVSFALTGPGGGDGHAELRAAFQRVHDSVAQDAEAAPIARYFATEHDPCVGEFIIDRLGPDEIELRSGITVASIDADLAAGDDPFLSLDGIVNDPSGESPYDFEFRADLIQTEIDCSGGLDEAWKWDAASGRFLLAEASDGYAGSFAVEDITSYVDCIFDIVQPTEDEMLASMYYWYYDEGGTGGPLEDGPSRYFELAGEVNDREREMRRRIADECDVPV